MSDSSEIEVDEEACEELFFKTGFNVESEVEILHAMLEIAQEIYTKNNPALKETREAVKKSVKEICTFLCEFVDCL